MFFEIYRRHSKLDMSSTKSSAEGQDAGSWRQRTEPPTDAELSPELEKAMQRLDEQFWIPGSKLKDIVKRFREELEEGTQSFSNQPPRYVLCKRQKTDAIIKNGALIIGIRSP